MLSGRVHHAFEVGKSDGTEYELSDRFRSIVVAVERSGELTHWSAVPETRAKVSVTVQLSLLRAVDAYSDRHQGVDRSRAFDDALYEWYAKRQE